MHACKEQYSVAVHMASWFADRSVTRSYYRGAAGALLVYDIARFAKSYDYSLLFSVVGDFLAVGFTMSAVS